ncbi:MAG: hypothetical protein JRJ79_16085 [Deltaproteobacteria bacterium]|nr:hypothetical protein [Deltaproteobacteria bacterium]
MGDTGLEVTCGGGDRIDRMVFPLPWMRSGKMPAHGRSWELGPDMPA